MTNNKIFLSMAALVFVGAMTAGCSSDDLTAETPQPADAGKTVVMKTTISLSESASTRALDANGKKTFAAGDQIAVIYKNTAGETVKAESAALQAIDLHDAAHTATFSVTLTNPKASTPVRYIYPASMAAATVATDVATNDDVTINYAALATQDGTLASLASDLDLAVFDGTLTAQAVLPPATLENPLTIGKFTIKNSATDGDITNTVTSLTINDGTNTYTVNRTAAAGPIYVAMKPITSTQTVTIKAITADNKYIKSVTDNTLAKNTMYPINVSMTARYPLAVTATSVSSDDIGSVIGANGNIYLNAAAATTTTAEAVIAYVGKVPNYFDNFLAIALTDVDGSKHKWADALTKAGTYAAAHAITIGGTTYDTSTTGNTYYDIVASNQSTTSATATAKQTGWRLPSVTDWRYIFDGIGRIKNGVTLTAKSKDGNTTYSSNATPTDPLGVENGMYYYKDNDAVGNSTLLAKINEACGNTALQSDDFYWSSSWYSDLYGGYAWDYLFLNGQFWNNHKSNIYYVRVVFAY